MNSDLSGFIITDKVAVVEKEDKQS